MIALPRADVVELELPGIRAPTGYSRQIGSVEAARFPGSGPGDQTSSRRESSKGFRRQV